MAKNRLSEESSLYLKQHAEQPVYWWPWCEEAFEEARRLDRPVIVSIGYSSCHWCHVMAHECFDDDYIADLMNRHFICIKVDREERPDVDQVYMEAIQMLNQQGGWPLNVFCLPDKRPFTGGTYFPPEDKGQGLVPWPHLLMRISESYRQDREPLLANAEAIANNLDYLSNNVLESDEAWDPGVLTRAATTIVETLDSKFGGFGGAPKFPPSQIMGFLYAVSAVSVNDEPSELNLKIEESLKLTVHALTRSGLFDHISGGFFRYSVDAEWRIPHFEKMLYDNALLVETLSKLWSQYRQPSIKIAVEKTVSWLLEHFQPDSGRFAAALDADSAEGEGAYYLWTEQQVKESVSATVADEFCEGFSIRGKDPLNLYPWGVTDDDYAEFQYALSDLAEIRSSRSAPARDDKSVVSWNALMARALVVAGHVFQRTDWISTGRNVLDWLWKNAWNGECLASVYYEGVGATGVGNLDDYANLASAELQLAFITPLYESDQEQHWERAEQLVDTIIPKFWDEENGGFCFAESPLGDGLKTRKKEWFDNAVPSGNSTMMQVLSLLSVRFQKSKYEEITARLRDAFQDKARRIPNGVAFGLEGLTWESNGVVQLKIGSEVSLEKLRNELAKASWKPLLVELSDAVQADEIQLCKGSVCLAASSNIGEIVSQV
ncbi:MAG: thioredoxin domain-containing protein [Opitutales bacterium]|nr:thioredoxin domain-containing protein [Opitutales bacterium]